MIASNRSWDGEDGRYGCTQDRKPGDREGGLTNRERHAAGDNTDERRTEDAGAAMKSRHAGADGDKKRQSVHRQREDQPAEQADADGVEDKSKGEHGGGSICKGVTVAPSTTTAAQFGICN